MEHEQNLGLPAGDLSPAVARAFIRQRLAWWGLESLTEVSELVASELVTNAVRYGRPPLELTLARTEGGVRVGVTDGAPDGRPRLTEPAEAPEGGRGLFIVSALASRWGCEQHRAAKQVWCELESA